MKSLITAFDKLPKYLKIILALPIVDILWVIYRAGKSYEKQNNTNLVLAIVAGIITIPVLWIVDIVTLAMYDKILWID